MNFQYHTIGIVLSQRHYYCENFACEMRDRYDDVMKVFWKSW